MGKRGAGASDGWGSGFAGRTEVRESATWRRAARQERLALLEDPVAKGGFEFAALVVAEEPTPTRRMQGAALAADRTLGGLCDWVEAEAPRPVDLPIDGAASLKAAVIPVVLHYSTADPLA
jgi:hypothetical protein